MASKKKTTQKRPRKPLHRTPPAPVVDNADAQPSPEPLPPFVNARHISVQRSERIFVSLADVQQMLREKYGNEGSDVVVDGRGAVVTSMRVDHSDEGL